MLGPEQSNFALFGSPDDAVKVTETTNLVVIVDPVLAFERGWPFGQKLGGRCHREWAHLAEPGCERGQESGRCRLPDAWTAPRRINDAGLEAVVGARGDQRFGRGLTDRDPRGFCRGGGRDVRRRRAEPGIECRLLSREIRDQYPMRSGDGGRFVGRVAGCRALVIERPESVVNGVHRVVDRDAGIREPHP